MNSLFYGPGPPSPLLSVLGIRVRGRIWFALVVVGITFGVFFLLAASLVSLIGPSFDQACTGAPLCVPAWQLRDDFLLAAAFALIGGVTAAVIGFRRDVDPSSFPTLPP
jgi:hypothetical protein